MSDIARHGSPFDLIRRFDESGNEFWMGRDLMKLLGYIKWQKFCDAIDRAKITCGLNNEAETAHFGFLPGAVKSMGRPADDYRLTRNACYWIAMAGDVRKPEISQAHQYFAVKTREAETRPQSEALRLMELKHNLARQADTMITIYGVELGLTLLGHAGQTVEVEKLVTEVVSPQTNNTDRIETAEQLKRVVKQKTGQNLKSAKQFAEALMKAGRDDLLIPVTRNQTGLYPDADRIDEALAVVYGGSRQRLITPVASQPKRIEQPSQRQIRN
jgi:hypothetical protein